jgi:carbamoyl-phosphate synthase large subunit
VAKANMLISSAGRRVGLLACFRDSIATRGADWTVFAIDSGSTAPAAFVADHALCVPRCTDPGFLDAVLQLCAKYRVRLLIPTIDTELPVYAAASGQLAEIGVKACISELSAVQICCNKIATHEWLVANGFPTVRQTGLRSALLHPSDWPLPLIAKPYNGSASLGVRRIQTRLEFEAMVDMSSECIVQEIASGREFTINVYVNQSGECICAVPHWRMEVRAGEVSKGVTVKNRRLMDLARAVAEALPGAYGPLNIQCFMDDSGTTRIIEVNARFGGGYPLAHRAGGRFTDWLLDELEGKRLSYFDDWTDDLAMLRYDEAVFVSGSRIRTWSEGSALSSTSTTRCI